MLNFHKPVLSDAAWVRAALKQSGYFGCEYSFGNIFLWSDVYQTQIAEYKNFFFAKSGVGNCRYCFPAGSGDLKEAVEVLRDDAHANNLPFCMYGVTPQAIERLEAVFPNEFIFTPGRNDFDYIYRTADLTSLSGKKYHSKRNHIARFMKKYDWRYEQITDDNIYECHNLNMRWKEEKGDAISSSMLGELKMCENALNNFNALQLSGGLLRVDGEAVAYTFGEEINEKIFCVHVEKALTAYDGSYPMINKQFVSERLQAYEYVNREEDVGEEGLRKAKLSYHPAILLEKNCACLKSDL